MNTKIVMTLSAVSLALLGITLTFLPEEIANITGTDASKVLLLNFQLLGVLYFGFAMLNWMAKESVIGGIYNRPIAIANFSHFLIGGLALVKGLMNNSGLPSVIWVIAGLYVTFAVCFGLILYRQPVSNKKVVIAKTDSV